MNRHKFLTINEQVLPFLMISDVIAEALFPIPDLVSNNSIAFHPANGMFNANSNLGNQAVVFLLFRGEFLAARFLLGLKDSDAGQGECGIILHDLLWRVANSHALDNCAHQDRTAAQGRFPMVHLRTADNVWVFSQPAQSTQAAGQVARQPLR